MIRPQPGDRLAIGAVGTSSLQTNSFISSSAPSSSRALAVPNEQSAPSSHLRDQSAVLRVQPGSAQFGSARLGSARLGSARLGSDRIGSIGLAQHVCGKSRPAPRGRRHCLPSNIPISAKGPLGASHAEGPHPERGMWPRIEHLADPRGGPFGEGVARARGPQVDSIKAAGLGPALVYRSDRADQSALSMMKRRRPIKLELAARGP